MKHFRLVAVCTLLAGMAIAQDISREATAIQTQDLFSTLQSDRSLAMFVTAVQSSGMAKMLREGGPFTVFALSNRAFANLPKEDRETLLTDRAAMHFLMAHYIARGVIPLDDTASLQSARTLVGVKLHIDVRSEGSYVNGARLSSSEIQCANGIIHVLDSFDPGLVHDAVAMANQKAK
jgi:transforming growth factor-beta-induced protein